MAIDSLEKVPLLYHFTDRRNLSIIKEMGVSTLWHSLIKEGSRFLHLVAMSGAGTRTR